MRWTLRALALASLAAYGLSLYLDVTSSRGNPCPRWILLHLYLVVIGGLGMPPALIGSILATSYAARRRQWGWVAGLLVAALIGLLFLCGMAVNTPPPVVLAPITALASAIERALGLTACNPYSPFSTAAALTLVLLVAPLVQLVYSVSGARDAARRGPSPRLSERANTTSSG